MSKLIIQVEDRPPVEVKAGKVKRKHAALPWRIGQGNGGRDNHGNRGIISDDPRNAYVAGVPHDTDAEFICRAVNSHYELLEALKADLHDLHEIGCGVNGLDGESKELRRIFSLIDGRKHAIRAAIEKATK